MFVFMLLIAFTSIGEFLFINVLKVSAGNLETAKIAIKYGLLYPASTVFMAYKRGKLIKIQKTTLLVFERVIGTLISLLLFVLVPFISWRHGAGVGILMLTIANFATGIFTNGIFKLSVKKHPTLINHTL